MSSRTVAGASLIVGVLLCGACSRSEPPPPKSSTAPPAPKPQTAASNGPSAAAEIDAAVKERLARQEAASKLFDRPTPAPAAPTPPSVGAAPGPAAAPAPAMPRAATPLPERKPEPPRTPEAAPAKPEPPKKVETAKPEVPVPRLDVAAAKPSAAPTPAAPRVLNRVEPDFPRNAPDTGTVRARITMDAAGTVTRVEILEASPRRVFDRSVTGALSQWRFNEGPPDRTFDTEVVFRR